jgi:hypothetical protein
MKWLLFAMLCFLCAGGTVWAGSIESSSVATGLGVGIGGNQAQGQQLQSSQVANPSASVQQNFEATKLAPGMYRQVPEQILPGNVTIPAFFGPFVPGWKVLDDLTSITRINKSEAEMMGGGAKCLLKLKSKVRWETDEVRVLPQYDAKTMPEVVGWVFCTADGTTTIDVVADAAKLAMSAGVGGTDLVLLKHKVEFSTSGWGLFLTGGYTRGQLSGGEKENSTVGGGVSGMGYGKTHGNSEDGIVFGILRR